MHSREKVRAVENEEIKAYNYVARSIDKESGRERDRQIGR